MIRATHIIGLTSIESATLMLNSSLPARKDAAAAALAARWQAIRAGGYLVARGFQPDRHANDLHAPGRSFVYDDLAEDSGYVFLETDSRYMEYYAPAISGWQFDAAQLVTDAGALVCDADLGGAFDAAIWQACVDVAATLPRLARITAAELADFATRIGDADPAMLAFVADESEDPTDQGNRILYLQNLEQKLVIKGSPKAFGGNATFARFVA